MMDKKFIVAVVAVAVVIILAIVALLKVFGSRETTLILLISVIIVFLSFSACRTYLTNKIWHCLLGVISFGVIALSAHCLFCPEGSTWISMSGIAIGTFVLSLVWMNYLTDTKEAKSTSSRSQDNALENLTREIADIKKEVAKLKAKIMSLSGDNGKKKESEVKRLQILIECPGAEINIWRQYKVGS